FGLDFVPVAREPYDLVVAPGALDGPQLAPLWSLLRDPGFQARVEALGGYSTQEMGRRLRLFAAYGNQVSARKFSSASFPTSRATSTIRSSLPSLTLANNELRCSGSSLPLTSSGTNTGRRSCYPRRL